MEALDDDVDDDCEVGGEARDDGEGMMSYREIEIREQDRYLPIANIARIMKKVLPGNAKIAKDSKESIQECVSEFVSFITSEASDKCQQEKRKTINGDDLLWAMSTLGFEKYVEPLKVYLVKYRESVKGERPEKKSTAKKESASMSAAQPKSQASVHPPTSLGAYAPSMVMAGNSSMMMNANGPMLMPQMSTSAYANYNPSNQQDLMMSNSYDDSSLSMAPGKMDTMYSNIQKRSLDYSMMNANTSYALPPPKQQHMAASSMQQQLLQQQQHTQNSSSLTSNSIAESK